MRILAFAYACEPGRGSEPGAGWSWARMLAGLGETWVVTRANNREAIEAGLDGLPEADRLHFVYVDLPEGPAAGSGGGAASTSTTCSGSGRPGRPTAATASTSSGT